jgi:hypothetical protein
MMFLAVLPDQVTSAVGMVLLLADGTPEPEDVKAGWTAFVIFLLLVAAVAFLGRSLFKQLRKAQAAQEAGVYDGDQRDQREQRDGQDETAPGSGNGEPHRS